MFGDNNSVKHSKEQEIDSTYIVNNHFKGKEKSHICYGPKTMIFATLVIPLIFILNIRMDFEMGFKLVLIEILNIAILIANRIKVTKQGITYHRQFFSWGEIQTIGVAVTKRNTPNKFFNKMIYISKNKYEKPVRLLSQKLYSKIEKYAYQETIDFLNGKPDYIITASFNRRLIHHIMAYWGNDIQNLNDTPGWISYVKLYNFFYKKKCSAVKKEE